MTVTDIPAYYNTTKITVVKGLIYYRPLEIIAKIKLFYKHRLKVTIFWTEGNIFSNFSVSFLANQLKEGLTYNFFFT